MLEIRLATPADIEPLIGLDTPLADGLERHADIAMWVERGQCYVARRDGQAVGYVALTRTLFHQNFVELLMVAAPARRTGVGEALIRHCLAIAGGQKLFTSTNTSNLPMQGLVTRLGFIPSGRLDNLDEGDPELFYVHLPRG